MVFNFKMALSHFLYPPLCLHCGVPLTQRIPLLCPACLEQVSLISPQERCPTCFLPLTKGSCQRCRHRPVLIRKQLAAAECFGPLASLLAHLKRHEKVAAEPLGSLMAYQWLEYGLPLPDLIFPLPEPFWRRPSASFLLAEQVGRILSVPVYEGLSWRLDGEALFAEGELLSNFVVKRSCRDLICDKSVLLIAPLLEDAPLRKGAEALKPFFPAGIYALAALCLES